MGPNQNTIRLYVRMLRKLHTLDGFTNVQDHKVVIPLVFGNYKNIGTAKNIFSAIIWALRNGGGPAEVISEYSAEISRINEIRNAGALGCFENI